jgi:hypothetical protein
MFHEENKATETATEKMLKPKLSRLSYPVLGKCNVSNRSEIFFRVKFWSNVISN